EAGGVGTELPEHLVHLVDARERLHEDDRADRCPPEGRQELARAIEEVPIPARLGRVLELGEVEVDGLAAVGLHPSRVEERERGAEDRGVHRLAVDGDVGLVEVEPAFAVHEERQFPRGDSVAPAALGGGWPGMTCSRSARRSPSVRRARSSSTRAPSASCRRARYSQNAGVNSSAAPSTGANLTRVASTAMILLAYPMRALFAWRPR